MNADNHLYNRRYLLIFCTIAIAIIYILRLFYLQILSSEYKNKAANNAFYQRTIFPMRGLVYDRDSLLIVFNHPMYDLMITKHEVEDFDTLELCNTLNISLTDFRKKLKEVSDYTKNPGYSPYVPQLLISGIEECPAGKFQEKLFKFSGFSVRKRSIRQYKEKVAAQLLGYMSEASVLDLERDSTLVAGDFVGKSGIERSYDQILRGEKGYEMLLRDARGRIRGSYQNGKYDKAPIPGKNIYLSINVGLEALAEKMMQGKRGSIVAIEPQTGEVLCMVSAPSYDPSLLSGKEKGKNHTYLENLYGRPLYNRAIMAGYPPGSTFKLSQAAIFLHEGSITPTTAVYCRHGYFYARHRLGCHAHSSPLTLIPAISTSCNAYFCTGFQNLLDNRKLYPTVQEAFEKWKNHIVSLGFGYPLGIDLLGEKRGYIPNSKVYDAIYKKRWYSGTIISDAIGQGEILSTPLQIANLGAIIANRGYYCIPHVVSKIENSKLDTAYTRRHYSQIESRYWNLIAEGMAMAVTHGTCKQANFSPQEIVVCGKTGTAQNPHGKDHSVFLGFAPKTDAKIVVAVYVENGGFGSDFAVPIGRVLMDYYIHQGKMNAESIRIMENMSHRTIYYKENN